MLRDPMKTHVTDIPAEVAYSISRALVEMGDATVHSTFTSAITWPIVPLVTGSLRIMVTPKVISALLGIVNAGPLRAFTDPGFSREQVQDLVGQWQEALASP
jgi:hypothetical protein